MKNNNLKIALFGTSADPPTIGHKKIIEKLSDFHELVITYASDNPSKEHKENLFFRSLLLKTLINEFNNPKIIFDKEISSPWAVESIQKCKSKYNIEEINFVIGSDLVSEIFTWKDIEKIFYEVKLFIIPREGYPINPEDIQLIKNNKVSYELACFNIPLISSSMIRAYSSSRYSFLPKSLIPIIKANNLYNSINIEK